MSWSKPKDADSVIQGYCEEVKSDVLKAVGMSSFDIYEAKKYIETDDMLAFVVKIQISSDTYGYIHVQMEKQSANVNPEFKDALTHQTASSPINPLI